MSKPRGADPAAVFIRVAGLGRQQWQPVHLDGLAPVMMAVNPCHRAGGRSCRDQLGAIRAEGGGQLVEAMDRVAGRGMRHVMRDDEPSAWRAA